MDEKDDPIAHHRILAGRETPMNYGRNNNSPATSCGKAKKRRRWDWGGRKLMPLNENRIRFSTQFGQKAKRGCSAIDTAPY
jgi:hypothetical protein